MGAVYFYHLTREPLARALPKLIASARNAGWRVVVRGPSEPELARLDEAMWLDPPDGFLPHGMAGGPHDAMQPVLLTTQTAAPNGAQCLMSVQGDGVTAQDVAAMDRSCILFDGGDPSALAFARGQWTTLTAAGAHAQYWSQESGRWEMKAEKGG